MDNSELSSFKIDINLAAYAAAEGYLVDTRSSSRGSIAMADGLGDKILISVQGDGHWVYCSVRDSDDRGTIIDFVQRRQGLSLGEVRQRLRPLLGKPERDVGSQAHPPTALVPAKPAPSFFDVDFVADRFTAATLLTVPSAYLSEIRRIPAAVYLSEPFRGRLRVDRRNNILFPHWTVGAQLVGFEIKNAGFTGFAKRGRKGLFGSAPGPADRELVIGETAIDILSYAVLFGSKHRRFVSVAGTLNPSQPQLLSSAILKMPPGASVIAATDNDDGGDGLMEQLQLIFESTLREDLTFRVHRPAVRGDDWNAVLCGATEPDDPLLRN